MTDQIEISSWAPLKLKSDALPIELSGAGFFFIQFDRQKTREGHNAHLLSNNL